MMKMIGLGLLIWAGAMFEINALASRGQLSVGLGVTITLCGAALALSCFGKAKP